MVEREALKQLSARIGADPALVQAAGGNTSIKDGDVMWIKASGTWLRDAMTRDIFVPVDLSGLLAGVAADDPATETCMDYVRSDLNDFGFRPSIETTVHALMPQRVVVHVHCVETISFAIRTDAEARLGERLQGFDWVFIPYAHPGRILARAIADRIRPVTDVLVLGNHGLAVAADTIAEAEALLERVSKALARPVRPVVAADLAALQRLAEGTDYHPAEDEAVHALATDPHALALGGEGVFYPDHAVFLGVGVQTVLPNTAPIVAIAGKGVLVRNGAKPAVEPLARCLGDVMRRVEPGDPIRPIDVANVERLLNWDAEIYRQNLKRS